MKALSLATLLSCVAVALGASATPAVAVPAADRVDVSSIKVVNKQARVAVQFGYRQAPVDTQWVATVLLDTAPRHKGPEFGAFFDNQCGDGFVFGPVKKSGGRYYSDPEQSDKWGAGCGDQAPGKCYGTYRIVRDEDFFVRSITVRKVRGCMNPKKIRVYAKFTSLDLTKPHGDPSVDHVPGKKNQYTPWTRTGDTRFWRDRT